MKLINYFYLGQQRAVYDLFRQYFPEYIPDSKIRELLARTMEEIDDRSIIKEWFLFEERFHNVYGSNSLPEIQGVFYFMSSNKDYFIKAPPNSSPPASIGFCATATPFCFRVVVPM